MAGAKRPNKQFNKWNLPNFRSSRNSNLSAAEKL